MPLHPILLLIAKGESESLDFKKTISSAAKIAKTMVAFANHKGGVLLVGVNDNRTISGVKSEDEKYMLDLAASFYCKPEVKLELTEWELGNKTVIEAKINEGKNKPYYAKDEDGKWWVYVRVKDQSLLASKVVVDVLKRQSAKQNTLITYTKHEQSLLHYLDKHNKITLKQLCKLLNISRWRAQRMLINLVSAGVIRNHTTEKEEFFTLS
ncbi:MAG: RNA-binding domain-containing protein [Bacteroidota bacterium]|jgi:predicted HTH transcriptional regulator|nr:putative DNA binding domain-containing protein [Sphingobacteriales bacterium]